MESRQVGSDSPRTTAVINPVVREIQEDVESALDAVKIDIGHFLRGFHRYPTPSYLAVSSAMFSAKMTVGCIVHDVLKLLKTTLTTIFFRPSCAPLEEPPIPAWLLLHVAETLCARVHDLSNRHVFHIPSRDGFHMVYLDENIMVNGRQIIYLCIATMSDENEEPEQIELFRRGVGLEEPDRFSLQDKIMTHLTNTVW